VSCRPKPGSEADQLRELITEARGILKDLRAEIREARGLAGQAADDAHAKIQEELRKAFTSFQKDMNQAAADLNESVDQARNEIVKQLTISKLERIPGDPNALRITFAQHKFETDGQITERSHGITRTLRSGS
jgi:uncharacterized protein YukE